MSEPPTLRLVDRFTVELTLPADGQITARWQMNVTELGQLVANLAHAARVLGRAQQEHRDDVDVLWQELTRQPVSLECSPLND